VPRGLVHWLSTVRVPAGQCRRAAAGDRGRQAAGARDTADAAAGGSAGASDRQHAETSPDDAVNETAVKVRRFLQQTFHTGPTGVSQQWGKSARRRVPPFLSLAAAALLGVLGYLA
jgi:hypothetical protein